MPDVLCPNCRNRVADDGSLMGQQVICPHCGSYFRMPVRASIATNYGLPQRTETSELSRRTHVSSHFVFFIGAATASAIVALSMFVATDLRKPDESESRKTRSPTDSEAPPDSTHVAENQVASASGAANGIYDSHQNPRPAATVQPKGGGHSISENNTTVEIRIDEADAKRVEIPLVDLIEKVEASVVRIEAIADTKTRVIGSGFVVEASGMVATNYHVMEDAVSAFVEFKDGTRAKVKGMLYAHVLKDIAILAIDPPPGSLRPLPILSGRPRKGESVIALGAPKGFSFSVTEGIVSAVRPAIELGPNYEGTWVQTSAPISKGNSGGPLVNRDGNVVGINTLSWRPSGGENLNFAISAEDVQQALSESKNTDVISLKNGGVPREPIEIRELDKTIVGILTYVGAELADDAMSEKNLAAKAKLHLERFRFLVVDGAQDAEKVIAISVVPESRTRGNVVLTLYQRKVLEDGSLSTESIWEMKMEAYMLVRDTTIARRVDRNLGNMINLLVGSGMLPQPQPKR